MTGFEQDRPGGLIVGVAPTTDRLPAREWVGSAQPGAAPYVQDMAAVHAGPQVGNGVQGGSILHPSRWEDAGA